MGSSIVCLASGGFDSSALLHWCATRYRTVHPVYVRAGLRWEAAELRALRAFLSAYGRSPARGAATLSPLTVVDSPTVARLTPEWARGRGAVPGARTADRAVYLPGRNLSLLSAGASVAAARDAGAIAMGTLASNPFPDGRPAFFRAFGRAASLGFGRRLSILTPFRTWSKADVSRYGATLPLKHSLSCIAPALRAGRPPIPCGRCNKCAERARGYRARGRS